MSRQDDQYTLEIDIEDLAAFKEEPAARLRKEPDNVRQRPRFRSGGSRNSLLDARLSAPALPMVLISTLLTCACPAMSAWVHPAQILPLFEEAAQRFYYSFMEAEDPEALADMGKKPKIQLHIFTTETPTNIRSLMASHVSKLVTVSVRPIMCSATHHTARCAAHTWACYHFAAARAACEKAGRGELGQAELPPVRACLMGVQPAAVAVRCCA
jgi:hypothetical protein